MNLEQLRVLWAAAHKKCEDIRSKAATETRQYTADERTTLDAALAEMETLDADIKREETLQARAAAAQQTRADQLTNRPGAAAHAETHDNAEDKPFASFGEQLLSVRRHAESRGQDYDPRLRRSDVRDLKVRAAAGLNETTASDGGFLVNVDIADAIEKAQFDTGEILSRVKPIPISNNANGIKIPYIDETSRATGSRWGGVRAYWADEAASLTASKPKLGKLELGLKKLIGLVYMSDELMADASAMESFVMQAVTEELTFAAEDAVIRGSGAGVPLGILNASALVSVAKETSQAAASIQYANVSKMKQRMLPRSFKNAAWFVNIDTMPQLEQLTIPQKNVAGTENVGGYPVYMPAGGASQAPYGTLFGRPVIPVEQCETVGTVGDILLLDLGLYLMAKKGGTQMASSIHVNFLTDETAFRFVQRLDGQPAIKTAITPYKGTGTLSAFVALATRS